MTQSNTTKTQAIAKINEILDASEYEDGSYGGTFKDLEHRFAVALEEAQMYEDWCVCLKLGVEVNFPLSLVEAADPQFARWTVPTRF